MKKQYAEQEYEADESRGKASIPLGKETAARRDQEYTNQVDTNGTARSQGRHGREFAAKAAGLPLSRTI